MMRWLCCEGYNKLFQKEKKKKALQNTLKASEIMPHDRYMAATKVQLTIILIMPASNQVKA